MIVEHRHRRVFNATTLLALGVALATLSLARGVHNAQHLSQDLQYSGARLLIEGKNPYTAWLHGDRDAFLLSQAPNYGPLLYFLMAPLAAMDWPTARTVWSSLNAIFALLIALRLYQSQRLHGRYIAAVAAVAFLASLPVRIGVGNGQQALLVLLCMIGAVRLMNRPVAASLLLAVALTKYSLGAFVYAALTGARRYPAVLLALVITLASFLALAHETSTPVNSALILSVLRVGDTGLSLSPLLGSLKSVAGHGAILGLAATGIVAGFLAMRYGPGLAHPSSGTEPQQIATVSMATSLAFAPHLTYDYVVIIFPLVMGLRWCSLAIVDRLVYGTLLAWEWNVSALFDRVPLTSFHFATDVTIRLGLLWILIRAALGHWSTAESTERGTDRQLAAGAG